MSKRILITGGTGFIGHVLCRELLARDYELTVFSRQPAETVKSSCGRVEARWVLGRDVPLLLGPRRDHLSDLRHLGLSRIP